MKGMSERLSTRSITVYVMHWKSVCPTPHLHRLCASLSGTSAALAPRLFPRGEAPARESLQSSLPHATVAHRTASTMASLVCPRGACLRAVNSVVRPSVRVAAPKANFTTSTAAPSRPIQPLRASIICRMPPQAIETPQKASSIRFNSTTASPTPGSKPDPSAQTEVLTWDKFFDLRRKRRYINLVASIGTAAVAVSTLAPLAAQQDFDSWGAQISGLDPMIVLGITTFTIGAGGWLCGPTFGSAAFRLWAARKGWGKAIMEVRAANMVR